ncbi:MAG: hypothetical protein A2015_15375 [Spirochaetes bacterium GWF1_31_7]|nr:MAG: hypothetical protein A2Y30_11795 [Spirochaetes bacterium GWE1_32_154]OHD51201.1 MAG: hypothetical protein A2Y29_01335 [Spirochaetes bacterium GWE2_31_10]OHD52118.1 MAG: hypothetical protein A2015_15375 [Spirochaetes bacterium GWF1_31_7]OHD75182.1 MAG: hypothetical protein A2355_08520 [Spirochaetes bacterium RIFOXYB1_FULL_32_8]HBD96302.1 hypothetical protein [Spirochaetia bacterium]
MKSKFVTLLIMTIFAGIIISCEPAAPIYQSSTYISDPSKTGGTSIDAAGVKTYNGTGNYVKIVFGKTEITVETIPPAATFTTDGAFDSTSVAYTKVTYTIDSDSKLSPFKTNTNIKREYYPVIKSTMTNTTAASTTINHPTAPVTRTPIFTFNYDATYGFILTFGATTLYPEK